MCGLHAGGGVDSIVTPDVGSAGRARHHAALGRATRDLLADEAQGAERMAVQARRRAEERFDTVQLAAELERWLSELRARRAASSRRRP